VLHTHELSFVSNKAFEAHVCDVCQMAKSHQLPFPHSVSEAKAPLELVFLMFGVLTPLPLGAIIIMSPLLMIIVSPCEFTCLNTSLKFFKNVRTYKLMLNVFSIVKCWLCKPTGVASTKN
jgi:hypothetical protein